MAVPATMRAPHRTSLGGPVGDAPVRAPGPGEVGDADGATAIAAAAPEKRDMVRGLAVDSRGADLAAEVLRLAGGTGVDLVLESVGGAGLEAGLAATGRVTGRVVVHGTAGGGAGTTDGTWSAGIGSTSSA